MQWMKRDRKRQHPEGEILTQSLQRFLLLTFFILSMSACAAEPTVPAITVIPLNGSQVSLSQASSTPLPTRTPTATLTSTPAPTASATPYENIDFSVVEISFGGFLSDWRYFITFTFPEAVRGEYYAVVDKNKPYKCEVRVEYPDRLYCHGPLVVVYNWTSVELYALDGEEPLLTGRFFVPLMD